MSAPMKTHVTSCSKMKKYLLQFANDHVDFRFAEIKAISEIFGFSVKTEKDKVIDGSPFCVIELNTEDEARKLMSRTVLIKSLYELWGQGVSYEELYRHVESFPVENKEVCFDVKKTFKINVETYNKTVQQKDKVKIIENLPEGIFNFRGKVNLKNPDNTFGLLEYYGACGTQPSHKPYQIYFGKLIADGQRELIRQYHLTKRHFIGNTSMDAGLSLVMSNLGQVKENSIVFDPFVGTGSLLVACAHHGGYVMGTDIDYLLLHAKARPSRHNQSERAADESIHGNLSQYNKGHQYLDVIVADSSKHKMWRCQPMFDAIITDPPYGIREGAKRIGTEKDECALIEDKNGHIPQRVEYQMADIFIDLLNYAAKFLNINGRLVFWFPVSRESYTEENLPTHPCLRLDANCEQILSTRISRRLVTMVKYREYLDEDTGTAEIPVDHYDNKPFRDLYYKKTKSDSQNNMHSLEENLQKTAPYGIREGAKRIGTEKDECALIEDKNGHIPQRVEYQMADIFIDLLNYAAKFLNINGRLVFWFPVSRESYTEENLPTHPCLRLDANCEQILSTRISRRLVTMVKYREYLDEDTGTAEIPVDHYDNKPFRDLYYKKTKSDSQNNMHSLEENLQKTGQNDT